MNDNTVYRGRVLTVLSDICKFLHNVTDFSETTLYQISWKKNPNITKMYVIQGLLRKNKLFNF